MAAKIDEEVSGFIERAYKTAVDMLKKYRKHLDTIARRLIEVETIERDEFEALVADILPKHKFIKSAGGGSASGGQGPEGLGSKGLSQVPA